METLLFYKVILYRLHTEDPAINSSVARFLDNGQFLTKGQASFHDQSMAIGQEVKNIPHRTSIMNCIRNSLKGITLHLKATYVYTFGTAIPPTKKPLTAIGAESLSPAEQSLAHMISLQLNSSHFITNQTTRYCKANPSKLPCIYIMGSLYNDPC